MIFFLQEMWGIAFRIEVTHYYERCMSLPTPDLVLDWLPRFPARMPGALIVSVLLHYLTRLTPAGISLAGVRDVM
jgi:hypothetical protein